MHRPTGKIFLFIIIFVVTARLSQAQPVISYLLPDIGTPGMNTYMEVIAPISDTSDFGVDGFYFGNRSDIIQIVCANPSDTQYVRFGPCVVSWKGRMISTQVFVLPWANPSSSDWRNGIKIPIQVLFDGDLSNADTFYIVQPQHLSSSIVLTSPGTLGSGSGWGQRSRRGAMIVDSLALAATGTYTFSTSDCDPFTPGNQGFLPFTLISKGRINIASSTTLDASSTGVDGGPGGGGGGDGLICDTKGGDGFTGGGGNSHWYNSCDGSEPAGDGTGNAQNGLNGVPGGETSFQNEGGGGGTGHPFGAGGAAGYFSSANSNPPGSFGGGNGGPQCCSPQEGGGGGGGFAIKGFDGGLVSIHTSGGNINGNPELVPLSGGSGGGGGNVNSADISGIGAGSGGGGGGAIILYGLQTSIKGTIRSNGGNGVNSFNNDGAGGGGSGGAVICGGKISVGVNSVTVSGGVGGIGQPLDAGQDGGSGSTGRARFDGPAPVPISVTSRASKFAGPSTDASDTVAKTFTLTGSGNGSDIQILVRPLHGQWSQAVVVSNYARNGNLWSTTITLPGNDSVYLLAAAQKILNPSSTAYTADPTWILSQSAANILYVLCPLRGITAKDSTINFGTVSLCADVFDTVIISNNGCSNSVLSSALADLTLGVSIVNGGNPSLPVQSKDTVVLHLHPNKTGFTSTILTVHTSLYDITIPVTWTGDASAPSILVRPDVINLGSITRCEEAYDTIIVQNVGCDSVSLANALSDTSIGISLTRSLRSRLAKQGLDTIIVHLRPKNSGQLSTALHLHYGNRDTVLSVTGEVTPGAEALEFTPAKLDFGVLALCRTVFDTLILKSTGCDTLRLSATIDDPTSGAAIIHFPNSLIPSGKSDTVIISFRPHRTGTLSANILLNYQGGDSSIGIKAFGVNDSTPVVLSVSPSIESFECDSRSFSITLKNPTCDSLTLAGFSLSGKDTSDFFLQSSLPAGIASDGTVTISGSFSPQDTGARNAIVTFHLVRSDGSLIDTTLNLAGLGDQQDIRVTVSKTLPSVQALKTVTIPILSLDSSVVGITVFDFGVRLHTDLLTPENIDGSRGLFAGATVDRFTVFHDSVSVRLHLSAAKKIIPGELCAIVCRAYVSDTLSTVISVARSGFADASSTAQCLATTNTDSVLFTLDAQCGEPFISHFLANRKVPSIDGITPNPSSGLTKVVYFVPVSSYVKIEIFNQLGESIRLLSAADERSGSHERMFDLSDLPSGRYFFRMLADGNPIIAPIDITK
ncbi:MAG: choice-of-anchor D domain-containing protein [Bacteroidota bacterium]|nr:choice-of-anchor D domain-containing protein [Bacteroidota bacterium]